MVLPKMNILLINQQIVLSIPGGRRRRSAPRQTEPNAVAWSAAWSNGEAPSVWKWEAVLNTMRTAARTRLAALDVAAPVHMALRVWHTKNILKPQLEAAIEQRVVASVARMCHRRKMQTANKLMPCGRFETTPGRLADALERRQRDAQATGFRLKAALRRAVQHRRQRRAPARQ